MEKNETKLAGGKKGALQTRTDLSRDAVVEISNELRQLLADVFALYVKTKNFHWHMSGSHFRSGVAEGTLVIFVFWCRRFARDT